MCCSVLTNVAGLGDEEKYFLLRLGTIQRVVDVFLRLESIVNTSLPDATRISCIGMDSLTTISMSVTVSLLI